MQKYENSLYLFSGPYTIIRVPNSEDLISFFTFWAPVCDKETPFLILSI